MAPFAQGTSTNEIASDPIHRAIRKVFEKAGVDFTTHSFAPDPAKASQKAVYFNHRTGWLFVRATLRDLDNVENTLKALNIAPQQMRIDIQRVNLKDTTGFALFLQNLLSVTGQYRPVLTDREFRAFTQQLAGVAQIHDYPGFVTLAGKAGKLGIENEGVVEITADSDADHALDLRVAITSSDATEKVSGRGKLYDGQTYILNLPSKIPASGQGPRTLYFIQMTLIDPAGNRIHDGPDRLPFDPESTPVQPLE